LFNGRKHGDTIAQSINWNFGTVKSNSSRQSTATITDAMKSKSDKNADPSGTVKNEKFGTVNSATIKNEKFDTIKSDASSSTVKGQKFDIPDDDWDFGTIKTKPKEEASNEQVQAIQQKPEEKSNSKMILDVVVIPSLDEVRLLYLIDLD
jgi:hypothetical protein